MPPAIGGQKVCAKCRVEQSVDNYNKSSDCRDGLHPWCRPCRRASRQAFYWANVESVRERQTWRTMKHKYGLTQADFEEMLERQGGLCAICRRGQTDSRDARLCIDHDHATGVVRGLLCTPCNLAIGYFQDDIQRLADAANYLRSGPHHG